MNELLKKLLSSEVLTEETRQELETAFKTQLDEAVKQARDEAQATVTAELNEQWITEREALIEALDSKVTEALASELKELRADIENFRDLEVETNQFRAEMKEQFSESLKKDVATLIEQLDSFLEIRLTAELDELREDVATVKKNEFGKSVFEAFVTEFKKHYADDGSVEAKLSESEQRLEDALAALEESEKKASALDRSIKLEKVLAPLSGRSREVMEAILKNVDTTLLEDAYKTYVGRVLKETVKTDEKPSEKEDKVLAEGKKETVKSGVVKNGDDKQQLKEDADLVQNDKQVITGLSDDARAHLRRLAGL